MWLITILFGAALAALGYYGYVSTNMKSLTALIPSAFGAVLVICGALAISGRLRKHVMHAAVLVGLIGFVGGAVMAGPKLQGLLRDGYVPRPDGSDATIAIIMQALMGAICLGFIIICVVSFVQARIQRKKKTAATEPKPQV